MGFKIHQIADSQGFEYLPSSAITPEIGKALVLDGGTLKVATGTTKPTYICACHKDSAVKAGDVIPVIRVRDDMIFETTSSVALTSVSAGSKVTISTDGMQVTATTTDGVAEIVSIEDRTVGGKVHVRFS